MSRQKSKNDFLDLRPRMYGRPELPVQEKQGGKTLTLVKEAVFVCSSGLRLIVSPSWGVKLKRFVQYFFVYDIEVIRSRREEWMKSLEGMNIEKDDDEKPSAFTR